MELTFEDLMFVPIKPTSSSFGSDDTYFEPQTGVFELPSVAKDLDEKDHMRLISRLSTKESRVQPSQKQATYGNQYTTQPATLHSQHSHHYRPCPGAAHKQNGNQGAWTYYVDPRSGAGKCHHPDCTWGHINGKDVVTDFRGYAYTSRGDPVLYLLSDGRTTKHVRLSLRR